MRESIDDKNEKDCNTTSRGLYFFFSSRRRHTRCSRDWSSDVCSSDLGADLARNRTHASIDLSKDRAIRRKRRLGNRYAHSSDNGPGLAPGKNGYSERDRKSVV